MREPAPELHIFFLSHQRAADGVPEKERTMWQVSCVLAMWSGVRERSACACAIFPLGSETSPKYLVVRHRSVVPVSDGAADSQSPHREALPSSATDWYTKVSASKRGVPFVPLDSILEAPQDA
jgi:hypothetical protein